MLTPGPRLRGNKCLWFRASTCSHLLLQLQCQPRRAAVGRSPQPGPMPWPGIEVDARPRSHGAMPACRGHPPSPPGSGAGRWLGPSRASELGPRRTQRTLIVLGPSPVTPGWARDRRLAREMGAEGMLGGECAVGSPPPGSPHRRPGQNGSMGGREGKKGGEAGRQVPQTQTSNLPLTLNSLPSAPGQFEPHLRQSRNRL